MDLTFEQIKTIAVGAVEVTQEADGIHFRRMNEELERAFAEKSRDWYARARCTTECRLEFHTDSRNLRVDFGVIFIESNTWGKYEIYVDGLPVAFVRETGTQKSVIVELPEGDKHVTVALPGHNIGIIRNVIVDEGSYIRPHSFDKKMLFLGDSITQGYNANHDAMSYSYLIARHFNAESLNWAVGGAYFCESTVEATDFNPDIVFVAYGTNDYTCFRSMEELRGGCARYLDKIKALYGDKKVFCISPIWRADGKNRLATGTHAECRKTIIQEIEKRGFIHIDGYKVFPHMTEYFEDSYLHPNDHGFAIYAGNLIRILQPLI